MTKSRIKDILESICIFIVSFGIVFLAINLFLDYKSEKNLEEVRNNIRAARIQSEQLTIPDRGKENKNQAGDLQTNASVSSDSSKEINIQSNETTVAGGETEKINKNNDLAMDSSPEKGNNSGSSETEIQPILEEYKKIQSKNADFAGWLYVEGTDIDYPYMQGPDNAFYLSHNMERTYDKYGMLIMDVNCSHEVKSPHLIIYGHNVNSGKLFGELLNYKDEAYYGYHPELHLDMVDEAGLYDIFAVYKTTVDEAQKELELFTTWEFEDKESFDKVVKWAKDKALYDTGVTPEYGKAVLSLVTCEHSRDEGRFVVMAVKR